MSTHQSNQSQNGFILVPVVFTLIIVAILAYQLSRESAFNTGTAIREQQMQAAQYVAEAGLQHAIWQLNQANCNSYADLIDIPFGEQHRYSVQFIDTSGNPVTSGSPVTLVSTATLADDITKTITRNDVSCDTLVTFCDGNFIANHKVSEFSTSGYSSTSIKGLTYLPAGKTFKGIAAPADGAWVSIDSSSDEIYMTDLAGSLLVSNTTPATSPTGISFISSGTYADHLVISDYSAQGITFVNLAGNSVSSINTSSIGASNPVDVAFIGTTENGLYEGMIALLNVDRMIYIIDQSGTLQTSIDATGITSQAEGVAHLPGKDLLMLVDKGLNKVLIIDFSGNLINSYSTTIFGSSVPYGITIHPETCTHVIGDLGVDKIIVLDNSESGSTCNGNFRDEFNAKTYTGNDGTLNWATDWIEVGESDGPTSGDERVKEDQSEFQLRIKDNDNGGEGVEREANLSGATSASLSFDYRLEDLDNSSDYVNIEISTNGGTGPWNQLAQFSGPGDTSSYANFNIDISSYISNNTRIRFITSPNMGGSDIVWFDNIEIQCSP